MSQWRAYTCHSTRTNEWPPWGRQTEEKGCRHSKCSCRETLPRIVLVMGTLGGGADRANNGKSPVSIINGERPKTFFAFVSSRQGHRRCRIDFEHRCWCLWLRITMTTTVVSEQLWLLAQVYRHKSVHQEFIYGFFISLSLSLSFFFYFFSVFLDKGRHLDYCPMSKLCAYACSK